MYNTIALNTELVNNRVYYVFKNVTRYMKICNSIVMTVRKIFINNMKFYRKQAGLTQEKLAEKIGMSTAYIGDMEARERFPSAETIDKIALALGISPATLFSGDASPENLKSSFKETYTNSLKKELSEKILKEIEEVCNRL